MEAGAGGGPRTSYEIVRDFLEATEERDPRPDELRRIRPALDDLAVRIARLQRMSPQFAKVELNPRIVQLIRMAREQDGWLRSAAGLL